MLSVELGTESAGCYASLFYYNEHSGEPEFISESQITENGIANLEFTHASDYIVVVNEKSRFDENDTGESSGSSESSDTSDIFETESGSNDTAESKDNSPTSTEGDPTDSSESAPASSESVPTEENPKTGIEIPFIAVLVAAAGVATAYVVTRRKKDRR